MLNFTSFSNKTLKDFSFFFSLVLPKVVVEGLQANPIQGENTLCEVYNMDPYYWNTTLMKAGLLACVHRANRALHVLVNNTGSCTKRRKSQREPLHSCQSATSPIKIGGETSLLLLSIKMLYALTLAHNGTLESEAAGGRISRKDVRLGHKENN